MPADGRFSGEHHRVGVVEDGVGDVADLGARGSRFLNHRLQHMCGDDCRSAHRDCLTSNALLNQGHAFKVHVHAEVSAGEHHGVGRLQDIRRCLDGGACLDLGDDQDRRRAKCRAQGVHVGRLTHEGLRDVVGAQRAGSHEVLAIAVRDGRQREALGGHVDACVRPQHASSNDFTNHLVSCSSHAQLNRAIRHRYPIARLHVAGQPVMICCRAMRVADLRAASQRERCTGRQHHPARRQPAEPNLWAGQVHHDRMGRPARAAAACTARTAFWCSAGVPCEKLMRATSIPAATRSSTRPMLAGPIVATILVRRRSKPPVIP